MSFLPVDIHGTRKGLRWDSAVWVESLGLDSDVELAFGPLDAAEASAEAGEGAALPKSLPAGVAEVESAVEFGSVRVSNVALKSGTVTYERVHVLWR